jgi:hypothetical protein
VAGWAAAACPTAANMHNSASISVIRRARMRNGFEVQWAALDILGCLLLARYKKKKHARHVLFF